MLLFSTKNAFDFSILRIREGLSHVQHPLSRHFLVQLHSSGQIVYTKQITPVAVINRLPSGVTAAFSMLFSLS